MLLHSSPATIDAVVALLLKAEGPIAVMAGHFSLVYHRKTGALVPGIAEDIDDEETRNFVASHQYMGSFPVETWRAGIEIVKRLHSVGRDAKLLILVNDWQHVRPATSGRRSPERDVYFANPVMPLALQRMLDASSLDDALLTDVRDGRPCIFWCESRLRARYNRHLRVRVPVHSPCAQEWVPMLARLEQLGFGGFAAFVPGICRIPIVGGTERANECLDLTIESIIVSPMGGAEDVWSDVLVES